MRERSSGTGELTIRYKIWQTKPMIWIAVATALYVALAVYESASWPVLLEVTPSVVRARQGRVRGRPDLKAARTDVCEIRYCPRRIVFGGSHGQSLMAPYPFWTLDQVMEVAGVLDVPVYDCRGKFRLKTLTAEELGAGRLVKGDSSAGWW